MNEVDVLTEPPVSRWRRFVRFFLRSRPVFWKTLGCLGGIVIPAFCFLIAMPNGSPLVTSKWQSGNPNQYANLMLQWPSVLPFYPILLFCMVCCWLVLFGGQRWIDRIWIRFGIYTGIPVAVQFHVLLFSPNDWNPVHFGYSVISLFVGVAITLAVVVILMSFFALAGKLKRKIGDVAFVVLLLVAFAVRCLLVWVNDLDASLASIFIPYELGGAVLGCLILSTVFATTTYSLLAWHVWHRAEDRRIRFGLLQMLGGLTWSAAYLAAWRASVVMAIAEYKTLPMSDPRCYVCTAAARGHRRFVGSFEITLDDGTKAVANRQLQVLKAAELAVMVTLPKLHHGFRWIYNRVGPKMAACLATHWIADIGFVTLKLIEWPASCVFWVIGIQHEQIHELYKN